MKLTLRAPALNWGRWLSVVLAVVAAGVGVAVMIPNLGGYPMRFSDEGVYISQAWAVEHLGQLANYTYWYDHPPLGWVQLAGWMWATDALGRYNGASILAGREFMVIVRGITCILIFVLARRLGMRRIWAVLAVLLYALSPLSTYFGRHVMLDSIGVPWVLGGFIFALSPKRNVSAAIGSALCLMVAVLTKETLLLFAPVILYAMWQHYRGASNLRYVVAVFLVLTTLLIAFYPLFALTKGELIPGEGHVSLIGTILWQLANRSGSGSILDPSSDTRNLVGMWLSRDYWLPLFGVLALVPGLFIRRIRPMALAVLAQVAMMFRTGYLPYMYVIAMLPFMSLLVAGVVDRLWPTAVHRYGRHGYRSHGRDVGIALQALLVVGLVAGIGYAIKPAWQPTLISQMSVDADRPQREAIAWTAANIPRTEQVVVEGENWLDMVNMGFSTPEAAWVYKVDTDPEVQAQLSGWRGIDYLILNKETISMAPQTLPLINEAIKRSDVIREFGKDESLVVVMKVRKDR